MVLPDDLGAVPAPETLTLLRFETDALPERVARAARPGDRVSFFASPTVELVGLGTAWSLDVHHDDRRFRLADAELAELRLDPDAHVLVGFSFDPHGPRRTEWDGFASLSLVLPEVTVVRRGDTSHVIVALRPGRSGADVAAEWGSLGDPGPLRPHHPSRIQVEAEPSADAHVAAVQKAVDSIRSNGLLKVVLSRSLVLRSDTPPRPFDLVAELATEHPDAYRYAFARDGAVFVGATPELLVEVHDGVMRSVPLAGTGPRGHNDAEDQAIAARLLSSHKDRFEHRVMVDDIVSRLDPLVPSLVVSAPSVQPLGYVQHLVTRITGVLPPGVTLLGLAGAVHPTPAVGGVPLGDAMAVIDDLEHIDRGWYAGGVGWIDGAGNGEIAVALRCALIRGTVSRLFAGGGIVAESDPLTELDETSWKFRAILRHLGEG